MKKKLLIIYNDEKISNFTKLNNMEVKEFFFSKKINKNFFKILKKGNLIYLILSNKKEYSLENKILFLSEFLEIINNFKIKNKIFILNETNNSKDKSQDKLENTIFLEIIRSYINMFKININFLNFKSKKI